FNLIQHQRQLAVVTTACIHTHSHDGFSFAVRAEQGVVRRTEAAVGHFHHCRFWVCGRYSGLVFLPWLLLCFHLRHSHQRSLDTVYSFLGVTQSRCQLCLGWLFTVAAGLLSFALLALLYCDVLAGRRSLWLGRSLFL